MAIDERVQLFFLKPLPLYDVEKPYHNFIDGTTNVEFEERPLQSILDVRGREREFTLDVHGFEYRRRLLPVVNWRDEGDIKKTYVEDLKAFMRELVPETVQRCEMFDFRLRSAAIGQSESHINPGLCGTYKMPPALLVHIDQSPLGVLEWLKRELGEEEATHIVENYRVRLINIWRPLIEVVEDSPLAMCDARTASFSDLVSFTHISGDYARRNFLVKYNENFQFYYLSRMTKEEVCAFLVFDSCAVGRDALSELWEILILLK